MRAYLDNSATTRCLPEAAEVMTRVLTEDYGNPSSLHNMGLAGENYIKEARSVIAKSIKAKEKEIIFTSGGTESNNLAIFGAAAANRRIGNHIITTAIEHAAVREPIKALEEAGFEVTVLPVDARGTISPDELRAAMRPETVLVSIMHVNNEIGSIEPVEEAAAIVHELQPHAVMHVDAIQSFGKLLLYPSRVGIDLMSVSGHKLHGPKGSGFLYICEGCKVSPQILGGGHEQGYRSGTENVPAIAGLGVAVEKLMADVGEHRTHMYALKDQLSKGLLSIEGISLNGPKGKMGAPHIVSATIDGVRAEVILHALEEKEVYVSAGSACSSNRSAISRTLKAIGLKGDALDSTIRFSTSVFTTEEEIDYAVEAMRELVPMLRKFKRR